ncbi:MAG TPA: DNA-directed RNA polymerase subunit H [Candidatus Aenigmarchaeota archaeon]|nr:DNA-directed RNA polymerase subunit H [Candidatus Aenigmarchaeota archaeon]
MVASIDILKHDLVPDFRILSENEKKELLERLRVSEDKLPKILESDVIVKRLGAKVGDVLEIKRKSPTAGIALYYRIVVKG